MKKVFLLSKLDISLAKEEVLSLAAAKKYELIDNLLILDADFSFSRLAYTKSVYDLLFKCKKSELENELQSFGWQKIFKKSFCIRVFGAEKSLERDFADIIWEKLKNPKVDLMNPGTSIHIFFINDNAICCLLKEKIDQKSLELRRTHLRPQMKPISLHPRLARCMVNLTGIQKGTLIDPFCGTGGILIEAGLMGLKVEGYDIDREMAGITEKNLDFFKIRHKIHMADSTKISKSLDYVAADLPYGKATKKQNLKLLYKRFLDVLKKHLKKRAVLGFPNFINYRKIIKDSGMKIRSEFTFYVHRSLSRKIVVIEK